MPLLGTRILCTDKLAGPVYSFMGSDYSMVYNICQHGLHVYNVSRQSDIIHTGWGNHAHGFHLNAVRPIRGVRAQRRQFQGTGVCYPLSGQPTLVPAATICTQLCSCRSQQTKNTSIWYYALDQVLLHILRAAMTGHVVIDVDYFNLMTSRDEIAGRCRSVERGVSSNLY